MLAEVGYAVLLCLSIFFIQLGQIYRFYNVVKSDWLHGAMDIIIFPAGFLLGLIFCKNIKTQKLCKKSVEEEAKS